MKLFSLFLKRKSYLYIIDIGNSLIIFNLKNYNKLSNVYLGML